MYTTTGTTLGNICKCIPIQVSIFCSVLTNGYGFVIHSDGTSTNKGNYVTSTATEPTDDITKWWESVIAVVLTVFILSGLVGFFIIARRKWRKIAEAHAQGVEDYPGQYNRSRPFRRQELSDWPTPHQAEYYNHIAPEQIIPSTNNTIDDPPAYDAAVQGFVGQVRPRKFPLEAASFDSDISIIESPPSYFTVEEKLQNMES